MSIDRRRIPVAGADAVVAELAAAAVPDDGLVAARVLGRLAPSVGWAAIRDEVVASPRSIVLAERPGGPILVARWFAPAEPTTIHDHGWAGAALLVEGACRYERFDGLGPSARCRSSHDLCAGEVTWWGPPPDDVHRQEALRDGALELVLLAGPPGEPR